MCSSVKTTLVLVFFTCWLFGNRSVGCGGFNSSPHFFPHGFLFITSSILFLLTSESVSLLPSFFLAVLFSPPCVYKSIFQRIHWSSSGPWSDWLWFKMFSSFSFFPSSSQYCAYLTELGTHSVVCYLNKQKYIIFLVVLFHTLGKTKCAQQGCAELTFGNECNIFPTHRFSI